jgi:hypothetical protein
VGHCISLRRGSSPPSLCTYYTISTAYLHSN